ncbi:TonB-linked outer membrane protein, SusC/RagA family [Sphingobacterium psychroaquaticum]|uniref:TonB-linked outer membrane protein, SusC/RagA family n=2 Tax=Sphingobacterium psychroaquaticum TaxID=561061 RepID=A0A1X7HVZ7_9SPHI|nr:TonB-linked outer membrane protein, SusC/RagA family [Sphingobacterium psychroaquaticum]
MQKFLFFASGGLCRFPSLLKRSNLLFLMRVNLICGLLLTLTINLLASNTTVGQNINTTTVEMGTRVSSLRNALKQLERETGMRVFYPSEVVDKYTVSALRTEKRTIGETLTLLLEDTSLGYQQRGRNIVLFQKEGSPREPLTVVLPAAQQQQRVSGQVVDQSGKPIAGVSVVIRHWERLPQDSRANSSTATDENGHWSLAVPSDTTVFVFSFIGYQKQEIVIGKRTRLLVTLKPDQAQQIEDVVVTGLFERPKEMYTGAARSFTQAELQNVSSDNVLTALKSLDPSFQMPENLNLGSNPNALPDVTLRGGNSLIDPNTSTSGPFNYANNPNTPLFILDGFEVSLTRINDLDLTRIKSIDLLKDATATSIYGSRAANGVVVIETIRPKAGKLNVTYTGNMSIEAADLSGYNVLNAADKLEIERKIGVYDNTWNAVDQQLKTIYNARRGQILSGVNTDWLAQPVRTGIGQKHNVYLEGGQEEMQYGISVNYYNNAGAMKGSNRQTMTGNTFLSYRYKNLIFKNDLTLTTNKGNNSPYGSFRQYTQLNPYWTPFNADGSYKIYLEEIFNEDTGARLTNFDTYDNLTGYKGRATNPLYDASLNIVDKTKYNNIINNFALEWQAASWLRVKGTFAYMYQADEADRFLPAQHSSFTNTTTFEKGSYDKTYGKSQRYEGIFSANLNKTFGKSLVFATLGTNFSQEDNYTEGFRVVGFPNATMDNLTQGLKFQEGTRPEGTENIKRLAGLFSNASYAYDNRYLLDFSFRLDGSSQFGSKNRFAPFWSAGAGWNVHKEELFKNIEYLNRLKLRYSFGYTGSQNFDSFYGLTTSRYFNATEYRGLIGTYLLGFGNDALAWQKTQKNNFGVDITLFNRLDLSANYYIEKTEGSIASISTAPSTGFADYKENMGDLETKGWELYSRYNIIASRTNRNNWSIFLNLFSVKNKITKVSNTIAALNKSANEQLSSLPITRYAEGQSTTAIWAVPSLGIDPASGYEIFLTREGKRSNTYNPLDQIIIGDSRSDLEGTFGTSFEVNGIGMNAFFRFRVGGQAYNQTLVDRVENVNVRLYNVDQRVADERWLQQGDHSFYKGLIDADGFAITTPTYATSRFVQNDNLLSLESLSVFYRFKDTTIRKWGLSNTKITAYSNDVFRLSSIRRERGLDYPFARSFTLQLSTSF